MVLVAKPKRTPAVHHKKRSGQHHKHSRHYVKPYLPYLPLIAIVGIGAVINGIWAGHMHGVLGSSTDISATQLLADTNIERTVDHENSLTLNNQLTAAAQAKAQDMVNRNYWSHWTPDGRSPWSFINGAGYQFAAAGENLAYGLNSGEAITNAWMNSPEHRVNVLNGVFTQVGFGIASGTNFQGHGPETVVVAMYGEPASVVSVASVPASTSSLPATVVSEPQAASVSRVQALSAREPWALLVIYFVVAIGIFWFILRHGLFVHRTLVKGEVFIIHHPLLDVAIVSVATLGIVLTQTAGYIH